jgi:hypothetical protein
VESLIEELEEDYVKIEQEVKNHIKKEIITCIKRKSTFPLIEDIIKDENNCPNQLPVKVIAEIKKIENNFSKKEIQVHSLINKTLPKIHY